jgi:uncharacterized protein (UPF0276 family)
VTAAAHSPLRDAVPSTAGIGLRAPHYRELLDTRPAVGWLEVHSENFFGEGGQPHWFLERLRAHYPLSLHGVGLGLGSVDPLGTVHLDKIECLIARYQPGLVSEHLCWNAAGGRYANDLLPLPYTDEALAHVCARIERVQERLRRQILVENVSSYLRFRHSTIPEWEFLAEVICRTGCGLLLDINNVYVSAVNHEFDAREYLAAMPAAAVQEIHLAGFETTPDLLIDTHGRAVADPVWALYRETLARIGPRPTLIEWDTDIPPLPALLAEAHKADALLGHTHAIPA